jgi:hypothetical protein
VSVFTSWKKKLEKTGYLSQQVCNMYFVSFRIREDKTPEDATSAEQIAEMYRSQDVVKNQSNGKATNGEADFDF